MDYLEFVLYGLIQGFTEFLPISSTAHLKVISVLFGLQDPGSSLSAIIQLGSVLAVLFYFRGDIFLFKKKSSNDFLNAFLGKKFLKSIFIGTIPIVFLGGFIRFFIPSIFETTLRSNLSIGIISIIMAIFMYLADISRSCSININNHSYKDSLIVGIAQAFAIVPGVSRSGVTISTALLSGWDRKEAAKFSLLLGIPSITLAAIAELILSINKFSSFTLFPLILGLITTFLSSLFSIQFLIRYLSFNGLRLFIYYRIIFGIVILMNL